MPANFDFQWLSPLGLSVVLFSLYGLLSLVVGIALPLVFRKVDALPGGILYFSRQMDTQLFGRETADLAREAPALTLLQYLYMSWLAGVFLAFGIFQLALTWFGLRSGQAWALATLTLADLVLAPYFVRTIRVYTRHGVAIRVPELPPLYTLLVVIPLAAVLGWFGLRAVGAL